jgi:hypothetical protein
MKYKSLEVEEALHIIKGTLMAEDPFDMIKVLALLFLVSLVAMNMPDINTLN